MGSGPQSQNASIKAGEPAQSKPAIHAGFLLVPCTRLEETRRHNSSHTYQQGSHFEIS